MKTFIDKETHKIQFLDENAYSEDQETWYPSVTTILNGGLPKGKGFEEWLKAAGENAGNIAELAMNKGSRIHDAIEHLIKGEEVFWSDSLYDQQEWEMINRFVEFYDRFKPKLLGTELSYVSHSLKCGGTIDLPCVINGELWIIDHKTGKDMYDSYKLQLAAYKILWDENNPNNPVQRYGILWLNARTRTNGKEGSIQGKGWQLISLEKNHDHYLKVFKNTRENFDFLYPNWKPKNLEYPIKLKL